MRSSFVAIAFCMFAGASAAQCVAQGPAAGARSGSELIRSHAPAPVIAPPGAELIKTKAANTQEQPLPLDDGLPEMRKSTATAKPDEKQPRHTGSTMLLAALAVMSGIVLRRTSASMQ